MKVPKGQRLWETVVKPKSKETWAITSDEARTKYILYKIEDGKPAKVKTAASPAEFEEIVGVRI